MRTTSPTHSSTTRLGTLCTTVTRLWPTSQNGIQGTFLRSITERVFKKTAQQTTRSQPVTIRQELRHTPFNRHSRTAKAAVCLAAAFMGLTSVSGALAQTHSHLRWNADQSTTQHYPPTRPAPQHMQWIPGYWVKTASPHRKVWVEGHWAPRQYAYNARYHPPHWDRDGDGVANRYDRRPNNPRRW